MQHVEDMTATYRGYRIAANLSLDPLAWKLVISARAGTDTEEVIFSEGGYQDPTWAMQLGHNWVDAAMEHGR